MYRRKASLDHRPKSIIVYTGMPFRYIAIAEEDRREWSPHSSGLMFKDSEFASLRNWQSISRAALELTLLQVPFSWRYLYT
jgi:hypothetical protein